MDGIEEIDKELTKQFEILKEEIKPVNFRQVAKFQINDAGKSIPWEEIGYSGIYLLEIKNTGKHSSFKDWITDFRLEWEREEYLRKFTPNLKKVRIKEHFELNEWIPIYIGKSRNIKSRVHDHLYKELNKSTFALKLMARENMRNETFRLQTIKIEVENYDAIVPRIELQLRNRLNPLIGKQ